VLYYQLLISKAFTYVNKRITQFYLPPKRLGLSTSGMNHTCLETYFPAAERHRNLAGTHFPSHYTQRSSPLMARIANTAHTLTLNPNPNANRQP